MTDRSNSAVSPGALEELTRGIEEKARGKPPPKSGGKSEALGNILGTAFWESAEIGVLGR